MNNFNGIEVSPLALISLRSLLRFILSRSARNESFNPFGVGALSGPSPGFTWGYYLAPLVTAFHIQPLWGWGPLRPFPRFHLGLLSRSARYCVSHSTPFRVGALSGHPPGLSRVASYCVSPGAIISLCSLLRFIFNPFRVGALSGHPPGFTWGYYLAPLVTAFHIQPFQGWGPLRPFPRFHLGYYLALLVTAFHIQPFQGWGPLRPFPSRLLG
jgi:hypothetical protein